MESSKNFYKHCLPDDVKEDILSVNAQNCTNGKQAWLQKKVRTKETDNIKMKTLLSQNDLSNEKTERWVGR